MNAHTKPRLSRRWAALGATAALLAPAVILGAGAPAFAEPGAAAPQAAATEAVATGGTLEWGVRQSIRRYLEQFGHTEGRIAAEDGASYAKGDAAAKFPLKSGAVDPAAGTAKLEFGGALEMIGFGESWLYFTDLRLDVADGAAVLTVDLIESYNVKTRTDDIVLSTFPVKNGDLKITGDQLSFTSEEGRFGADIGVTHLPSYGGPTYAAPNDYTDPITVRLGFGTDGSVDPGPGTDPGTDPEVPETGPYGTSTGTAYSDTAAQIRVSPGYAVTADGSTKLTVSGTGFDPGTASAPANIYVGIGTMDDPSKPEAWRRSQGGVSGPPGFGDYTYGLTRLAVSHHDDVGELADATIDANGSWSFTMEVPGKNIPGFFGDQIDCVAKQCGIFAFGAHGNVKAVNEAFTPVFFDGQDPTGWPDRDGDDDGNTTPPVVVPPVVKPPVVTPPGAKECTPNGSSTGRNAEGAVLEVTPAKCLGDTNQKVTLKGTGYPTSRDGATFGGLYVLFGWVDPSEPNWAPTMGGASGKTFTYANDGKPSGTFQQMVNFPGNTTGPGMPTMDDKGNWTMELPIEKSQFTSAQAKEVDCIKMTCGIITIGAHGLPLKGGEVFTPIYFTADEKETGTEKPDGGDAKPIANPNANTPTGGGQQPAANTPNTPNAGATGPLAKTGDEALRGLMFGGVLMLSAAAFAFAMLRLRRPTVTATTEL
ncbi:hypothetical protein FM113_06450 [Leucobacter sp. 7(1)]|uniref:HtaA domain-containing protein n=1 Tax=Leucobacter sp. 7(1) TaxID=1255613 RepID=UPI00097F2058|nr:HtaA domain-containing protein [Leucobacter sp. 7(1)]SJN09515.1 hypothetical protein FM113_06450 [Leucobacter sp. 7(1)]